MREVPENIKPVLVKYTVRKEYKTIPIYQYDVGHVLNFEGFNLPEAFEVHFALTDTGDAVTQIGSNDQVAVPDVLVQDGRWLYAWVYVADEDTGLTKFVIQIPVIPRGKPTHQTPSPVEQSEVTQAIAALNAGVEQAEAAADDAEAAQEAAETARDEAVTAKNAAEQAAQTATEKAEEASASASNAGQSATAAAGSASEAAGYAQSAVSASQAAAQSARATAQAGAEADRDARAAAASAATAASEAANAAQSASQAEHTVQDASAQADRAEQAAEDAETAKTGAETARTGAETAQSAAAGSATAAAGSATAAQTSAGNAASSATAADQSAQAAAQSATAAAQTAAQFAEDITDLKSDIESKQDAPQTTGTAGQVLSLDANGNPVWATPTDAVTPDGTYDDLTAGNAKQLLSDKSVEDQVPYKFRPTGGDSDREYLDAVVGGTVAWNQIANINAIISERTQAGITYSADGSGKIQMDGTNSSLFSAQFGIVGNDILKDHVYYPVLKKLNGENIISTGTGDVFLLNGWTCPMQFGIVTKALSNFSTKNTTINFRTDNKAREMSGTYVIQIFDFTQMFGSTIADYLYNLENATPGAGVAMFRSWFPNDYYEYNPGELISVSGLQSHDTVGFNAWDGEWELGEIYSNSGTDGNSSTIWRSKNFIPVIPNINYFPYSPTGKGLVRVRFYGKNKEYLGYTDKLGNQVSIGYTFITPINCFYIRLAPNVSAIPNHDICISLSGSRNGEYEPYEKHSYPLDPSVILRGVPKLGTNGIYWDGDRYLPSGTVQRRYGVVDLGTLTWASGGTSTFPIFRTTLSDVKTVNATAGLRNCICAKYPLGSTGGAMYQGSEDKVCMAGSSYLGDLKYFWIRDSSYDSSTSSEFKTAMSGVYLVYELAEPTTEAANLYRNLQICDPDGTEEFVSTSIVPVGHVTRYPENLRKKIEGLPWNFDSIIAMTETGTTASKAYAVGDYFIRDSILYKVTSAIASGGTITPGTNCTATTIMAEIKALA